MLKKIKSRLKRTNNNGSSFVLVIVSATFLSILISALLMGMLLAYKLRYYKINSLNNFYSVEKAMDEIYAGIGATTNEHLYSAYTTTAELVVYYKDGKYTNLSETEANDLFKKFFMQGILDDSSLNSIPTLIDTLGGFVTDTNVMLDYSKLKIVYTDSYGRNKYIKYVAGSNDPDPSKKPDLSKIRAQVSADPDFKEKNIEQITFKNIGVKRTITLTAAADKETMAPGTYEQSIMTDLVLKKPEYNVSFDMTGVNSDSLYSYALLADMGLQVEGTTTNFKDASATVVNVKGNVYTATDYYNKDYNDAPATKVTNKYNESVVRNWGATDESANSGIYVDKASLTMSSDIIVNAGSLAAFNGANVTLSGRSTNLSELWTDNILIDGEEGGSIVAAANAYVYDDTELNAKKSSLTFYGGNYFGYSYSANDVRSIRLLKDAGKLPTNFDLRAHFSDSAIIVNGEKSTLDLKALDSLYIAGKSYIEFSKKAANQVTDATEQKALGLVDDKGNKKDVDYAFTTLRDYSTGLSLDVKSNQLIFLTQWETVQGSETVDKNGYTHVKLKLPKSMKNDTKLTNPQKTGLYDEFIEKVTNGDLVINAIKQTVSGHDYYYLYITASYNHTASENSEAFVEKYYDLLAENLEATNKKLYNVSNYESFDVTLLLPSDSNDNVDPSKIKAGAAVTAQNSNDQSLYVQASAKNTLQVDKALKAASTSKTFSLLLGNGDTTTNNNTYTALRTKADALEQSQTSLTDEQKISNFLSYMYINMKDHLSILDSKKIGVDGKVELEADGKTEKEKSAWSLVNYTSDNKTPEKFTDPSYYHYTHVGAQKGDYVKNQTTGAYDYVGKDNTGVYKGDYIKEKITSYNYSLTPLNHFVDFTKIFEAHSDHPAHKNINETISSGDGSADSILVMNDGDVVLDTSREDGSVQGIVICGGDVKFTNKVKSFRGLIIAGGKVICNSSISITADVAYTASALKKFSEMKIALKSGDKEEDKIFLGTVIKEVLKNYEIEEKDSSTEVKSSTLSDISYNDILEFRNWKKNVE